MPLTTKGQKIERKLETEYGAKKGESVLYAMKNAGKVSGIDHGGNLWTSPSTSGGQATRGIDTPQTTFVPGSGSRAQLPKTGK